LIEQKSLSEITLKIVDSIKIPSPNFSMQFNKNTVDCILAGLILYYDNFRNNKTNPLIFEIVADLIKKGADYHKVNTELQKVTKKEAHFLNNIFSVLHSSQNSLSEQDQSNFSKYNGSLVILNSSEFKNHGEAEASFAVEKIKTLGIENDLLVLWPSHASEPMIKGFFYSKKQHLINRFFSLNENKYHEIENLKATVKPDWLFLSITGTNINLAKETIIKLLV